MDYSTISLLKECNAGCKSATNSMDQILEFVNGYDAKLIELIMKYNDYHIKLGEQCHNLLDKMESDEKDPSIMARAFSWISTETKLSINNDSHNVASILIDGCNMGMKSIKEYLNKYCDADSKSKDIANQIITVEKDFMDKLGEWL